MPNVKQKKAPPSDNVKALQKKINDLQKKVQGKVADFKKVRADRACFPLLIRNLSIGHSVVDDTFEELRLKYKDCDGKIDVIVDSGGGDIDAAYNLANLFRKFGFKELNFIVPRWAKSAATLLVCAGDTIFMTSVAELGPLDPQITEINPLEKRLEQFSPLHIEATLQLIRDEFAEGNEKLAQGLMQRLQFPMTLGSFKKSLDISEQYLTKLLSTRMLKGTDQEKVKSIAKQLTTGYADHGFSINADEANQLGLKVIELDGNELDLVWEIHKLSREISGLERKIREEQLSEKFKGLPPELLNQLQGTPRMPTPEEPGGRN